MTLTGPKSVVSICERNASGVISSKNPAWKLPALLTRTSSREPLHGRVDGGRRRGRVSHVQRDGQQVLLLDPALG